MAGSKERRAFDAKTAWVVGADEIFPRAVAVELAARGAFVWAMGAVERALGQAVGEIAYQGGQARHLIVPLPWSATEAAFASRDLGTAVASVPGDLHLLVVAAPASRGHETALIDQILEVTLPRLGAGGAILILVQGPLDDGLAAWTRAAGRRLARGAMGHVVNTLVLLRPDGDEAAAARLASLLLLPEAGGLSGQVIVAASG